MTDFGLGDLRLTGWASKGSRPPNPALGGGTGISPAADTSANWLIAAAVFGQLNSAYSNFHAVNMAQIEAKSQASAFGHRSRMLQLDRRAAERRAQDILSQGQAEAGVVGLEGAQRRAASTAGNAARGVDSSVGSAAEGQASDRLVEAIDVYNINLSSVRAANAVRAGRVAIENEALFARTSERNLRRSARVAQPEAQLIGGLGSAALTGYALGSYRSR